MTSKHKISGYGGEAARPLIPLWRLSLAKFKRWYIHAFQLSLGRMIRAPIATFFSFFFSILSFPLFTHAAQVTLAWDASTDPSIAGYKVYYGASSRSYQVVIDVGNITTYTISNLQSGSPYYFATTDYNTSGLESGYSNEVSYNAGRAKIGVFRNGPWFLDLNGNGVWDGSGIDACYASFGWAGDIPVAGDWNGTGTAKIGVFRNGQWFLDLNGNGVFDGCGIDACYAFFGTAGDIPVAGEWDGTGVD